MKSFIALFVVALASCTSGLKVKSHTTYITKEQMSSDKVALVAQFTLDKANRELYADVDGVYFPVASTGSNYQASWVIPYDRATRGDHKVSIYTKKAFTELNKYNLDGEGTKPTPVDTFTISYNGVTKTEIMVPKYLIGLAGSAVVFGWVRSVTNAILATE